MKYYHGTTEHCAESIDAEGFYGSEVSELTDGFSTLNEGGVVYVYDNPESAKGYGDVVYEIELLNGEAVLFQEDMFGVPEYYIPVEQLREDGIWKRLEAE